MEVPICYGYALRAQAIIKSNKLFVGMSARIFIKKSARDALKMASQKDKMVDTHSKHVLVVTRCRARY